MPPIKPLGKKPKEDTTKPTSFPELKPDAPKYVAPKSKYEEIQDDELLVLQAIYNEDFRQIQKNHGAWKKTDPSFEIRIKSSLDKDIAVTLSATLTATYPKTTPLLSLKDHGILREGTLFKVQKIMETKPKELIAAEQPMIMEIVTAIQDVLEDAAEAVALGRELPNLEEERANHEAIAARVAEEQRVEEEKKRQLESLEDQRMLDNLVKDEMKRRQAKAKEAKRKSRPAPLLTEISFEKAAKGDAAHDMLAFDQPIESSEDSGEPVIFQVVTGKVRIRGGPVSTCYTVRPVITQGEGEAPLLALKQTKLTVGLNDYNNFKRQLQALEKELDSMKRIRHKNILEILEFKVHKSVEAGGESNSEWTVSVLSEYAEKGSLEELLDITGALGVDKVRSWTIELLDALQFLHQAGVLHEDIHAGNVLITRNRSGEVRPKLSDGGYQKKLHGLSGKKQSVHSLSVAKSAYWFPPEIANTDQPQYTQKTDVWDFGLLFLQMLFGMTVVQKYSSPLALADSLSLSDSLHEFVQKLFKADPKKRPRAFELTSSEFLATDAPILDEDSSALASRLGSMTSLLPVTPGRRRHDSMNSYGPYSRYKEDFVEEGRLGKGGFGEVVKARKKLDGQIYAIKKITQKSSASLTEVLKEVRLLSQLSHPSVVRYYNTWTEELPGFNETDDDTIEEASTEHSIGDPSTDGGPSIEFGASTGGLDFISSSGFPQIEFGYDSQSGSDSGSGGDDDEDDEQSSSPDTGTNGETSSRALVLNRTRSGSRHQRSFKTVLYISMEYCEKRTLRDLIKRGLYKDNDEIWRLFRQVLEGLVHIHGLNVVHRDLKPENIFIDGASNVRIGDFGLATSGQYSVVDKSSSAAMHISGDLTRSIGTATYVAPEVRSSAGVLYSSKVDMYSLGIIFFEMCYKPITTGMERDIVMKGLRQKEAILPADFNIREKPVQTDIILSLLNHSPKERPSSAELLQSGKLPVQMESETIRQTLAGLADSRSPYYHKMMSALFSRPTKQAKDVAWDMSTINISATELLLQGIVRQKLISIFRHHGAVETPRSILFPRSGHYGPNTVQLLDPNGTLLQLPYDLTLPHARAIAKHEPSVQKSFAFGQVFRDKHDGGQPQSFGEVDFDVVSNDSLDLALKEAEVMKVLDEVVLRFPILSSSQMCFHLNHSDLLGLIFDFCRIDPTVRPAAAETLSKLNVQQWTWQKIRNELRSPLIGISATSVDDLQRFDFRDSPTKAFQKLKTIFEGTDLFDKASSTIAHLRDVIAYTKLFCVRSKIYVIPLGSLKEKFYKGGVLFSCLYDRKVRDVFAAGGRYDSLIREHRHRSGATTDDRHAVGFNLAWEKLARLPKPSARGFLKKADEEIHGIWNTKRCDVLVASFDATILRSTGVDIVQTLWSHDISAELARDSRSPEDLLAKYRDDHHSWIVIIKQDAVVKVKSVDRKEVQDTEIPSTQLLSWLRSEIRERDQREGVHQPQRSKLLRHSSQPDNNSTNEHEQEVRVLVGGTKSKKSNRRNIVEQAQARASSLVQSFLDGPIAAIETTDHVLELIRETRLSDPESWRKVTHSVPTAERRYIAEIHDMMTGLATQNKEITRNAFVYNFRTGMCIYYDLAA